MICFSVEKALHSSKHKVFDFKFEFGESKICYGNIYNSQFTDKSPVLQSGTPTVYYYKKNATLLLINIFALLSDKKPTIPLLALLSRQMLQRVLVD